MIIGEKQTDLRDTFLLVRGEYDKPDETEKLHPNVPAALPPLPESAPPNRLGLSRWLVSREHPLTARVIMNRFWQSYFGVGIVKTAEEFGAQGDWPTHRQLLDWLAVEFLESGWDIKHMQKYSSVSRLIRNLQKTNTLHKLMTIYLLDLYNHMDIYKLTFYCYNLLSKIHITHSC